MQSYIRSAFDGFCEEMELSIVLDEECFNSLILGPCTYGHCESNLPMVLLQPDFPRVNGLAWSFCKEHSEPRDIRTICLECAAVWHQSGVRDYGYWVPVGVDVRNNSIVEIARGLTLNHGVVEFEEESELVEN